MILYPAYPTPSVHPEEITINILSTIRLPLLLFLPGDEDYEAHARALESVSKLQMRLKKQIQRGVNEVRGAREITLYDSEGTQGLS